MTHLAAAEHSASEVSRAAQIPGFRFPYPGGISLFPLGLLQ
jgi:hypothetical protein